MEIHETRQGAVTVLKPAGPLIEADAEQFKQRALKVHGATLGRFVIDATDMPFVDSRGLESLVEVNDQMSHGGKALKLCGANETVREVLELTDLASMFEHFEDVNSAVRSFL